MKRHESPSGKSCIPGFLVVYRTNAHASIFCSVMLDRAERIRELCTRVTTTKDETILISALHELRAAITEHIENMRSEAARDIGKFNTK